MKLLKEDPPMEITRVSISRAEFQDFRKTPSNQHLYAEVILIDRSNEAVPQVYQLSLECISNLDPYTLRNEFHNYKQEMFTYVGDLVKVVEETRHVFLANDNVLTYKYLINFSADEHPLELSAALNTLKNALLLDSLRIQEKILNEKNPKSEKNSTHSFSEGAKESKEIDKIAKPRMGTDNHPFSNDIASTAKKRCQVKL